MRVLIVLLFILFISTRSVFGQPVGVGEANTKLDANAGASVIAYFPVEEVFIESKTPYNESLSYYWEQVAGPGDVVLQNYQTESLTVLDPLPGTYRFRLTITDEVGNMSYDETELVVNNKPNCSAGKDVVVARNESVELKARGIDADKDSLSFSWSKANGPETVEAKVKEDQTLILSDLDPGEYKFRLKVSDPYYIPCTDAVNVEVTEESVAKE